MTAPIELDRSVRRHDGGRLIVGGAPPRALRLTEAGSAAVAALAAGTARGAAAAALRRRLLDAGLAHPRPAAAPLAAAAATVVIPVRDRPAALARCLAAVGPGRAVVVVDDGSRDPQRVAAVCARHGAVLVRRAEPGGPAAARNDALPAVATDLVAFLDSDCVPPPGWLEALAGHFADPRVAAVAPRVLPLPQPQAPAGPGPVLARMLAARSPLDLGPHPARVQPGGAVAYVPTAALVVRRTALADPFDARLRYGEDVDLVWRLHDAGGTVRYDPSVVVQHAEPTSWRAQLARRRGYGSSAGPLARRHPGRLAPAVLRPGPAAVVGLAALGRPRAAAALAALTTLRLARRTRDLGLPPATALAWSAEAIAQTVLGCSRASRTVGAPLLAAGLAHRRTRPAAAALLLAAPLQEWAQRRPPLDLPRWLLATSADDAAYGLGVLAACARARTAGPLLPRLVR